MRSPIEVELVTDGSVMHVIRRVSLITILMLKGGFVPSTCQRILATKPRCSTWLISYDYLPDLIQEFRILSIMEKLHLGEEITNSENTTE